MKHLVPLLDEGVTLDRGDHVIVVLDGTGSNDVQQQINAICDLLAAPKRDERRTEQNR